jgi:hypothetical protein
MSSARPGPPGPARRAPAPGPEEGATAEAPAPWTRRDRALVGIAAGAWALLAAAIGWRLRGLAVDDFFITYRYAQNLAGGHGFVFNPGERVFGLTEPGLGLLLAALHAATRIAIPTLGTAVTAIALAGFASLMLAEAVEHGRRVEALIGGTLIVGSSYLWVNQGAAMPAVLALLLAAARFAASRPVLAGLLAGAAVWLRPDALAGVGLLGLLLLVVVDERRQLIGTSRQRARLAFGTSRRLASLALGTSRRRARLFSGTSGRRAGQSSETPRRLVNRLPWRFGLAAAVVVLAGALLARGYFGVWLPNTLAAKHAMLVAGNAVVAADGGAAGAGWAGSLSFWPRAVPLLARHWGPGWRLLVAAGLIGQWTLFRSMGRSARLLVLFAAFLDVAYPLLRTPFFSWYAVPFAVATLYGAVFAVLGMARLALPAATAAGQPSGDARPGWQSGWAGRAARQESRVPRPGWRAGWAGRAGASLAALLLAALLAPAALAGWRWFQVFNWQPHLDTYRRAAAWLAQSSAARDDVAYVEIGVLGFYSERPVVDLLGLVTPGAIPYVERDDLVGAFLAHPTRYVIYHTRGRMRPLLVEPWFAPAYEQVARFEQGDGKYLAVFRRRPGAVLPPPRPPRGT